MLHAAIMLAFVVFAFIGVVTTSFGLALWLRPEAPPVPRCYKGRYDDEPYTI